ncbi:L-threonylcarbamoyladenylate synthase [Nocardiopsis sp. NRRL B-16309]|uniref:L-threonylcarbamoyladenylate synthase n=1 Tax=Nocardiopsis sp. NRRL B-16309 TaxID=1519494 RepID=UPI0006AF71C1|nr:L-threonylcarbamoyladenylate synthase [Nocardiopsis sp. NRRL B-16309]KOX13124.1 translation factor Sua5 [Nocardiopsis sp. NRRL B-16309]
MPNLPDVEPGHVEHAADTLRGGGLVAFPTETVYGLGADAENVAAVERVFAVKGRPPTHPLIVHLSGAHQLSDWAVEVPDAAHRVAERFWPGPLTVVLRAGPRVPRAVTGGLDTVALRVPDHPVSLALLAAFGGGVAAPSANRFGAVSPTTADHVRDGLGAEVDYVLDGGSCAVGVESTIVDLTGEPAILRPGGVTRDDLEHALGHSVPVRVESAVRVPGQHPSHYAPRARVVLVEPGHVLGHAEFLHAHGCRVGVLVPPGFAGGSGGCAGQRVIAVPESGARYARRLYEFLRDFDRHGCEVVVASVPAPDGLGLAIADRLRRAAGSRSRAGHGSELFNSP